MKNLLSVSLLFFLLTSVLTAQTRAVEPGENNNKTLLKKLNSNSVSQFEFNIPTTANSIYNQLVSDNPKDKVLIFQFVNSSSNLSNETIKILNKLMADKYWNFEVVIIDVKDQRPLFDELGITSTPTSLFYYGSKFIDKKEIWDPYSFEEVLASIIKQ